MRLTTWAALAAVSVAVAALACITPRGSQRIDAAIAAWSGADPRQAQLAARKSDIDSERRATNDALRLLAADRDRLLLRVSSLERNLDDVTGSIKSQAAARPLPNNNNPQDPPDLDALPAITEAPPAKPAGQPDWLPNTPRAWPHPSAMLQPGPAAFPEPAPAASAPRARVAALPPEPQQAVVSRTDFGVDIGSGSDLNEARMLWNAVKAQHGRLIGHLRPIVMRREDRAGNPDYRLIIGPLANAAAAAKLCATLGTADILCSTRPYQGDRLGP